MNTIEHPNRAKEEAQDTSNEFLTYKADPTPSPWGF